MIESLELTRRSLFDGSIYAKQFLNPSSTVRMKNISGLGPVKANVSRAPSAAQAGSTLLGSRIGERNIVLTMEMTTDYEDNLTLSDIRRNLTNIFDPGSEVELRFHLNDMAVDIVGIVDSHEPEMFVETPIATVSIICPDPYFKLVGPEIELSWARATVTNYEFEYSGRQLAPVGFRFQATLDSNGANNSNGPPALSQEGPLRGYLSVAGYTFENGDTIKFNTIRGERGVTRVRSFAENNILGFFSGSLMDFQIMPGKNILRWNRQASSNNQQLHYRPQFTGI